MNHIVRRLIFGTVQFCRNLAVVQHYRWVIRRKRKSKCFLTQ